MFFSKPLDTIRSQDYLTVSRGARHAGAEVEVRYGRSNATGQQLSESFRDSEPFGGSDEC